MIRFAAGVAVVFVATCNLPSAPQEPRDSPEVPPRAGRSETIRLFDGRDLDGWDGYRDLWSVRDGEIVGKNTEPVSVSTYLLTRRSFTDFHLRFAAKLAQSEMHSGVALWGKVDPDVVPPKDRARSRYTYSGLLVMFPSGWGLYDLFGRNGLKVDTSPALKVNKQHDWNEMELFAQGNRVRLVANGVLVLDWREPQPARIREAPLGLQLHSNKEPQEVRFRGLVLTTFPDDARLVGKRVGDAVPPAP